MPISRIRSRSASTGEGGGGGGGAATINASVTQKVGIRLSAVLTAILGTVKAGVRMAVAPIVFRTQQKVGIKTSLIGATGTATFPVQKPAFRLAQVVSGTSDKPIDKPAFNITQVVYSLTRRVGGNAAALTTTGTQGWANQANAVSGTNGIHDASSARFTGNALAARNGTLTIDYANHTLKTELAITSVKLFFYYQTASTTLANGDVRLFWNKGGSDTQLGATITGDVNALTTPTEFDITASISSWADLDALQTKVTCDSSLGEIWTCDLDAVEVEVLASKTDAL